MARLSITFKLLSFIMIAMFFTTISVLFLSTTQLNRIIDDSQQAVYSEKLDAILGTLDRMVRRLQLTENVEAYEEDFKQSAIINLSQVYYKAESNPSSLIILDSNGQIIMHPMFSIGSMSILLGGIALLTNVIPLPKKRGTLFVYDENMQPTALMILALGLFVIIVAMAVIYFYVL